MKEKLQEVKFISGVQKKEANHLLVFFWMSAETMMHVKTEMSHFLHLCFFFSFFFPVVSPLVRPISKSSAHSIWSTTILQRVRRGGFMCWFILDFDICEKQEGFFKVAVHTSRQTALPFCPEDIQSSWLCILDRPLKQILLYKCCGGDTSFLSAYVALRKSVWSSSQSCSFCKLR